MKSLRKMVSVILCVVISCMCFVTPVCAAEKSEASVTGTNIPNIGIQQILMYPAIVDSEGNLSYGDPSYSQGYASGAAILNMTVSPSVLAVFNKYNCNAWIFEILYCSDSNVSYIDFKFNGEIFASKVQKTSSSIAYVIADTDYFTYNITYHLNTGATPTVGGHVNVR